MKRRFRPVPAWWGILPLSLDESGLSPALPIPGGMTLRVLLLFFFLALLFRIAQFRRRIRALQGDPEGEALRAILERRFTRGEITREEYERYKDDLDA